MEGLQRYRVYRRLYGADAADTLCGIFLCCSAGGASGRGYYRAEKFSAVFDRAPVFCADPSPGDAAELLLSVVYTDPDSEDCCQVKTRTQKACNRLGAGDDGRLCRLLYLQRLQRQRCTENFSVYSAWHILTSLQTAEL